MQHHSPDRQQACSSQTHYLTVDAMLQENVEAQPGSRRVSPSYMGTFLQAATHFLEAFTDSPHTQQQEGSPTAMQQPQDDRQ